MTFSISMIQDKSSDPYFTMNVSIYSGPISVKNSEVEVIRLPPRVSFRYPREIQEILPRIDQKKLELEILNRIAEYIMKKVYK